jgi:hypothetical protein
MEKDNLVFEDTSSAEDSSARYKSIERGESYERETPPRFKKSELFRSKTAGGDSTMDAFYSGFQTTFSIQEEEGVANAGYRDDGLRDSTDDIDGAKTREDGARSARLNPFSQHSDESDDEGATGSPREESKDDSNNTDRTQDVTDGCGQLSSDDRTRTLANDEPTVDQRGDDHSGSNATANLEMSQLSQQPSFGEYSHFGHSTSASLREKSVEKHSSPTFDSSVGERADAFDSTPEAPEVIHSPSACDDSEDISSVVGDESLTSGLGASFTTSSHSTLTGSVEHGLDLSASVADESVLDNSAGNLDLGEDTQTTDMSAEKPQQSRVTKLASVERGESFEVEMARPPTLKRTQFHRTFNAASGSLTHFCVSLNESDDTEKEQRDEVARADVIDDSSDSGRESSDDITVDRMDERDGVSHEVNEAVWTGGVVDKIDIQHEHEHKLEEGEKQTLKSSSVGDLQSEVEDDVVTAPQEVAENFAESKTDAIDNDESLKAKISTSDQESDMEESRIEKGISTAEPVPVDPVEDAVPEFDQSTSQVKRFCWGF